jgi:hypothetical protein
MRPPHLDAGDLNAEHRTSNFEVNRGDESFGFLFALIGLVSGFTSMFDVGCSMFNVRFDPGMPSIQVRHYGEPESGTRRLP